MDQIGRYQVQRELGRGAMGIVYEAHDPRIDRRVAIKTIRMDLLGGSSEVEGKEEASKKAGELRERLFREARSAGALSHPGIVVVYDMGQYGDLAFIAMEFVEGQTLEQVLNTGRPNSKETLSILRQTAAALDYAHERGVIHRDVKPANLMLQKGTIVKVADFGIAKIVSAPQLTRTRVTMGTPSYMSPEQIMAQKLDGRSDQFSLAVTAFEMLTGRKPFEAEEVAGLMYKIVYTERPSLRAFRSDLPQGADAAILKALAKEAAHRHSSCTEFVSALETGLLATAIAPTVKLATAPVLDAHPRYTVPRWWIVVVLVCLLIAIAAIRWGPLTSQPSATRNPKQQVSLVPNRIPSTASGNQPDFAMSAPPPAARPEPPSPNTRSEEANNESVRPVQPLPTSTPADILKGEWSGSYECGLGGGALTYRIDDGPNGSVQVEERWWRSFGTIQSKGTYRYSATWDGQSRRLHLVTDAIGGYEVDLGLSQDGRKLDGEYIHHPHQCVSVHVEKSMR